MPISLPGPARPSESAAGKWSSLFAKDEEDFGYAKAFCNRFPLALSTCPAKPLPRAVQYFHRYKKARKGL